MVTAVWDISTWNKIGHKRLSRKPVSFLSTSLDGKYLSLYVLHSSLIVSPIYSNLKSLNCILPFPKHI